jgi:hypothetical protein
MPVKKKKRGYMVCSSGNASGITLKVCTVTLSEHTTSIVYSLVVLTGHEYACFLPHRPPMLQHHPMSKEAMTTEPKRRGASDLCATGQNKYSS